MKLGQKFAQRFALSVVAGSAFFAVPAMADAPVAMVEDVSGTSAGVDFLQYLAAGTVIKLSAADKLVLDYFHSCTRETITGGTVTIGTDKSQVAGGNVSSEKVVCDGGQLKISSAEAQESGTVVYREGKTGAPPDQVQRTLYSVSPIFDLGGPSSRLVVEQIDKPGRRIDLRISETQLVQGRFYDFAKHGERLIPGATYRATANHHTVVFKVAEGASTGGAASLAGRLLQL